MRALLVTWPFPGHWHPLVPLARALVAAGHDVAFVSDAGTCSELESLGFESFRGGVDSVGFQFTWKMNPIYRSMWGHQIDTVLPQLLEIAEVWHPSLILHEETSFGGAIAGELLDLPHATVQVVLTPRIGDRNAELAALPVLTNVSPAAYDLSVALRYLKLSGVPPSFLRPEDDVPSTLFSARPFIFDESGPERLPEWVTELPARPTIHATMGTNDNTSNALFRVIIESLANEPVNLIVTIGRNNDPSDFADLPANIRVASYIPHSLLARHCDLLIAHGGWSTTLTAVGAGVPLLMMPTELNRRMTSGRLLIAERCRDAGVARILDQSALTPHAVRENVREMLADSGYGVNARRVQQEILTLPGLPEVASVLEKLDKNRAPLG